MIKPRSLTIQIGKKETGEFRAKVIKWKGVSMVRNHSFLATIREIIKFSAKIDVCKIGLVGDQHSGKSTLAQTIAHCVHKLADIPYTVRIFDKHKLLNFEQTLKELKPANYILVFDDVSFLGVQASKKQIDMIRQAVTEIRHLEGGQDVKIIIIMNYHYTFGLDKYLRQADYFYFLTVGSSEKDNMEKIVGGSNRIIEFFQKIRKRAIVKDYFMVPIGGKEVLRYQYREPFIPVLFFDNDSIRLIVTPTRQWLDPICSTCTGGQTSEISIEQFKTESHQKFTEKTFKVAVKMKLKEQGVNVYSPRVVQAQRYLDRAMEKKQINIEELAASYGFKPTVTKLRKKLDGVLA